MKCVIVLQRKSERYLSQHLWPKATLNMVNYFHLGKQKNQKITWQASFQQNNDVLVPTGYMEHKLQQSEKNGL